MSKQDWDQGTPGQRPRRHWALRYAILIRVGIVIAFILLVSTFHLHGGGYAVARGIYLAIIIGFLIWRTSMRRR